MRVPVSAIALGSIVFLLVGCGAQSETKAASAPGITANTIRVGTDLPLTGPSSSVGLGFQLGENLAVSEINSHGGINGRKLEIVYEDDAGTAQGGVEAAHRLVQQDTVFGNFSGASSTSAVSEVPFFEQNQVPLYESLASDQRILAPYNPYVFMGAAVPRAVVADVMTTFAATTLKLKNVDLMIASDQAWCPTGADQIKTKASAVSLKIAGLQTFHSGDTDFTAQIHDIGKSGADGVYICGLPVDGGRLVPQLKRALPSAAIITDATMANPDLIKAAGAAGEGVYSFWIASAQYLTEKTNPMANWIQRVNKFAPNRASDLPNTYTPMAYTDLYVFAEGLRRGGANPTRAGFIKDLNAIQGFVAGKDANWGYAAAIGIPRTFKDGDHNGNKAESPVVIKNGEFVVIK